MSRLLLRPARRSGGRRARAGRGSARGRTRGSRRRCSRSMISASTQCADVGWYSKRVPGSQLHRHFENRARRRSRSSQSSGAERRAREPRRVQHHLLDGDRVLAVRRELGDHRRDRQGHVERALTDQDPHRARDDRLRRREDHVARLDRRVAERAPHRDAGRRAPARAGTTGAARRRRPAARGRRARRGRRGRCRARRDRRRDCGRTECSAMVRAYDPAQADTARLRVDRVGAETAPHGLQRHRRRSRVARRVPRVARGERPEGHRQARPSTTWRSAAATTSTRAKRWQAMKFDAGLRAHHVGARVRRSQRHDGATDHLRPGGGALPGSERGVHHRARDDRADVARGRHATRNRSATSRSCCGARRSGRSSSASRARAPMSRRSRPPRRATATSGSSTARRSGRRARSTPTTARSSAARIPTRRSTRASPRSSSTCGRPASRSSRSSR